MLPELFEVPVIHITVKGYGVMIVIGFLVAVFVMRRMAVSIKLNPEHITNTALYALVCGIIGARVFYVIHYRDEFGGNPLAYLAIWNGGLEFLGGVLPAIAFIIFYMLRRKVPIGQGLAILSVGLMIGLGFGRIGCFCRGCCFGKPSNLPWAVRFPYGSLPYYSQIYPDRARGRTEAMLDLPVEYFFDDGRTISRQDKYSAYLKPYQMLTAGQKQQVTRGQYRAIPIHPTQLYSSLKAFLIAGALYLLWRRFGESRPAVVYSSMFILYGTARFFLEYLRDDNPCEYGWWAIYRGGTVSQNIAIYMIVIGLIVLAAAAIGGKGKDRHC